MFQQLTKIAIATTVSLALVTGFSPAEAKQPRSWSWTRQLFLRHAMNDPKQPKFIRGALRQQVIRSQRSGKTGLPRLKNPKGYDIGHNPMKRGSSNIKDLRFETTNDNRSRPGRNKGKKYF